MDEKVCRDCGTYNESTFICKNGKNPIDPKKGVKIDPECPACEHFTKVLLSARQSQKIYCGNPAPVYSPASVPG